MSSLCRRFVAIATLLWLVPTPGWAQQQVVHRYTNADGLPQAQCLSIFQDARGYMWFGTYGGVARYNGESFTTLTTADGLAGNVVRAIHDDGAGNLLIGTDNGLTILRDGDTRRAEIVATPIGAVRAIAVPLPGELWVGTSSGLWRLGGAEARQFTEADGLPDNNVLSLTVDSSGRLWIGTDKGVVRRGPNGRFERVSGIPSVAVKALLPSAAGVWVGSASGLWIVGADDVAAVAGDPSLRDLDFRSATMGDSDTAWFATDQGAVRAGAGVVQLFDGSRELSESELHAAFTDREGNLWFGSDDGVSRLTRQTFSYYDARDGLPHPFVRDITADHKGRLWLATRSGIATIDPAGRVTSLTAADGLPADRGYAIAVGADGTILLGTPDGLVIWDGSAGKLLTESDGLPSSRVSVLLAEPDGSTLIGTTKGVAILRGGRIEPIPGANFDGYVVDMARDETGHLWLGTMGHGLLVFDGETIHPPDGAPSQSTAIWSVAAASGGSVWVGTNGDGAYRIGPTGLLRVTQDSGLSSNFVWQVHEDKSGRVWFYTNRGLDMWDGVRFTNFDIADGLPDMEGGADAVFELPDGGLWFGTGKGVAHFDPLRTFPPVVAPPVVIEQVVAGGLLVGSGEQSVERARNSVTFAFAGLTFRDERRVRFRYRLLGVTDAWSIPTTDHRVSFASLPPGDYTFEVVAIDRQGNQSSVPARRSISIEPRLYEGFWFRAVVAPALLATLVLLLARIRTRRLAQESQHLRDQVELRTADLARSELRFRTTLRQSLTTVFQQDLDLRYTWVENPGEGFDAERMIGHSDDRFIVDPGQAAEIEGLKRRVLTTGIAERSEISLTVADKLRHYDLAVSPVFDDAGKIVGLSGSSTDISDRKRLETQLRESQKMEAIGSLAGGIAHDFNNLLTGISGFTEFARGQIDEGHAAQADLEQVVEFSRRAAALVGQLLAFSRKQPLQPVVLNLNELLEQTARMLRRIIGEHVELSFKAEPELGNVRADPGQIEQVLMNLAVNARDAMEDGGQLTIETSNITMSAGAHGLNPGPYVTIAVSDTGIGMSREVIERVFEPFFTTKPAGKGTGLGLATAYGIVAQHGGAIHVYSELGHGTTIRVFLPCAVDQAEVLEATPIDMSPSGWEKVLLVEDEPAVREVAARTLRTQGYCLEVAASPEEAIAAYERNQGDFALLVTDVVMPGGDGPGLYRQLSSGHPNLRVLYMSGYAEFRARQGAAVPSDAALLQKPFEPAALARKVREILDDIAA